MTPRERAQCMDQLDQIDREIEELMDEEFTLGADDEDREDLIEHRSHLEYERWKLLNRFPEVRYWPAELAAKGA